VGKPRWVRIAVATGAAAALAVAVTGWPDAHDRAEVPASDLRLNPGELPAGPQPAFSPGKPVPLRSGGTVFRWAPVLRPVTARRAPSPLSRPVTRLARRTPEGTTNLVLVLGQRPTAKGSWVRLRLPVLPNSRTGWVPRGAVGGYHFVHTHLVVDLGRLDARLLLDGRSIFRAPVGVGQPRWPTPRGQFYIRDELTDFASPFYGPLAFGTSARSAVLTDWPDGGFVGIHGTDQPELIPGRVSHGCIRLRNPDIRRLGRLMPVGTPLTVR
jgi:L,D-transpeptidase catalytic domain